MPYEVFYIRSGQKIREEASVLYLRKYVQGVLHWLSTNPKFFTQADILNAEQEAREALRFYQAL
jgi:hypothetical protein